MHHSASVAGESFAETYGADGKIVVDVGGRDVNGSLRKFFEIRNMKYICVDMETHSSVDIVVQPTEPLPFETGSVDLVVSTSCFEHDPCFWLTFREMCRILKPNGTIYINAPTRGFYHGYPGDNWRFFSDAGQALAYWSGYQLATEPTYPVSVIETFNILEGTWDDFICVWKKTDIKETSIVVSQQIIATTGVLERKINSRGLKTQKRC